MNSKYTIKNKKHFLDSYFNKYQWYRRYRQGVWYKHSFTKDANQIGFGEGGTWWARYDKLNRYSDVIEYEDYNYE